MKKEINIEDIVISTDRSLLDRNEIIRYLLQESYWAKNRSESAILRSIDHSLCFGVYNHGRMIGFARAVTDRSTVFYLADIFILPEYQGLGIGTLLTRHILREEDLDGLRGILTTQTAHRFYSEFGFSRDNDVVQRRIMVLENNQI